MKELHFPWLEISILLPLLGAIVVSRLRDSVLARRWSLVVSGLALLCTTGAWQDFALLHAKQADDRWHMLTKFFGREFLIIDQLNAPLLPLVALLYFLTTLATLRTKIRRFSFAWTLIAEAIALATFSCKIPWLVIGLLAAGTIPPYVELRARGRPTRVYVLHMALFLGLMLVGEAFVDYEDGQRVHTFWAIVPLLGAVLVRCGIVPFHCWMTDLFEHATFGTALLFVTPMTGVFAALRLVLPIAPDWVLRGMGLTSLITAVYAAGMSLVQRDVRRYFCYLVLSHSALVLVGLEMVTPLGLTAALCVWLSFSIALGGFGLTLRALESRRGRLSLHEFQGLYEHTPTLAIFFVLTGLASVGFPGTFGFVGTELLIDGVVETYPYVGISVVLVTALNGIAVVHAYFRLFTGTRYVSTVSLRTGAHERFAVLALAAFIIIGGLIPQPGVETRHQAAIELLLELKALSLNGTTEAPESTRAPHH